MKNKTLETRKYDQKLNYFDEDVYTVEDWKEAVEDGVFGNFDGDGYWVKNGYRSNDEVFSTPMLDATHVTWYNK